MLPKTHIIIGALFSIALWLIFPAINWYGTLTIFLASFLIDFDHYLYYVKNKRTLNLREAYKWFVDKREKLLRLTSQERAKYKKVIMIFHGIECWIILLLLLFVHKIFMLILVGILIHMILDFIEIYQIKDPFYQKTSQIYTYIKNKKKLELFKPKSLYSP